MKVKMEYEFKAKIENMVDLEELCPTLSYEDFTEKVNSGIDDFIRQVLADELAEKNKELVTLERINLKVSKVE